MYKIGIILPTRGDREEFLNIAKQYIERQTVKPHIIKIVDFKPKTNDLDITMRYRIGYEEIRNQCDIVFFWEDDDWYREDYLEWMISMWNEHGCPKLFGVSESHFYHIDEHYIKINHPRRACMYNTMVRSDLDIMWAVDKYRFMDMVLWNKHRGVLVNYDEVRSVGIKHGIGMPGSHNHKNFIGWPLHGKLAKEKFVSLIGEDHKRYASF